MGGGKGGTSASLSEGGVATRKCCVARGLGTSNPGGFRPGSMARGLLGFACPKTSAIASPKMSARGTKRLRALLDVRLRTDRSEASPWERSGSERPASDVCFRMSSSSMLSGSPKPIEAETLSVSVAPRGVQPGTLITVWSVEPRGVQPGTLKLFWRSLSDTLVAPRGVQPERRDPDEAERIDREEASRGDCAPARVADDRLFDFLPTTLVVSVPSSLSATASP